MIYYTEKYRFDIYVDQIFKEGSADNVGQYDFVYLDESEFRFTTNIGIKLFQSDTLIKSAVIGSIGGGTGVHETSMLIENSRLLVCCSDTVFCLSIPDLTLLWRTQADLATCFGIYKYQESYIVHGELEISRIDEDGRILWQHSGADIFTTLDGKEIFFITEEHILVTDWENRKYKFDFNGNSIL